MLAAERDTYVGPWLPEPLVSEEAQPDRAIELALLILLERLSPKERAAFLMHEVFDCGYPDIGAVLGKSEVACRQLVHRARERVRRDKPRFEVSEAAHRRLVERYVQAAQERDAERLAALLAPDAVLVSDGEGKVWAALRPVIGTQRITRLEMGVMRKLPGRISSRVVIANGQAGAVTFLDGRIHSVTSFETDGERILSVMRVLNPEKFVGSLHLIPTPCESDSRWRFTR